MHMRLKRIFSLIVAFSLVFVTYAQDRKPGTIGGVVKDAASKVPLVEAVVTVSSDAFTGQKFVVTDTTGTYQIINLPPGNYLISAEMEGYKKTVQQNVALKEGMTMGISFEMTKGAARTPKANTKKSPLKESAF
jgi:hypothetical protein